MVERVQIKGASRGYKRGNTFEIEGHGTWEQATGDYEYNYQYRPEAVLDVSGSRGQLKIDGHAGWVDVKKL